MAGRGIWAFGRLGSEKKIRSIVGSSRAPDRRFGPLPFLQKTLWGGTQWLDLGWENGGRAAAGGGPREMAPPAIAEGTSNRPRDREVAIPRFRRGGYSGLAKGGDGGGAGRGTLSNHGRPAPFCWGGPTTSRILREKKQGWGRALPLFGGVTMAFFLAGPPNRFFGANCIGDPPCGGTVVGRIDFDLGQAVKANGRGRGKISFGVTVGPLYKWAKKKKKLSFDIVLPAGPEKRSARYRAGRGSRGQKVFGGSMWAHAWGGRGGGGGHLVRGSTGRKPHGVGGKREKAHRGPLDQKLWQGGRDGSFGQERLGGREKNFLRKPAKPAGPFEQG